MTKNLVICIQFVQRRSDVSRLLKSGMRTRTGLYTDILNNDITDGTTTQVRVA